MHARPIIIMSLTLEEFDAYVRIKAYDVICSGNFRRHLSACRDNGDKWAITMYNGQNAVQARARELATLVGQLNTPHSQAVQRVCKDVMSCAQPPVKVLTGYNVCCLTGLSVEHCIDLTRMAKNPKEVHVHPRFRYFFMLLWYCAKLEYVIRACTKRWVEAQARKPTQETYTQVCEEYSRDTAEQTERLFRLFVMGLDYTSRSLVLYRDKCALRPALTPSQAYLDGGDAFKKEA
jgi:hypothetical protein